MRVAVLGMGRMGRAIAERLLHQGHQVTVWNRSVERAAPLGEQGAAVPRDIAGAVHGARAVFVMVSDDDAVRSVADAAEPALAEGATFINSSTVSRALTEELDRRFPRFVAAPIAGSPDATAAGEATVLLGGRDEVIDALDPLWSDLAARQVRCGPAPNASIIKLLNNLLLIGGIALMGEVITTARAAGLADDRLKRIFGDSPVVAPAVRARLDSLLSADHPGGFSLNLSAKDVRLALELAGELGLSLPAVEATRADLEAAVEAGFGDADLAAAIEGVRGEGSGPALS